MQLSQKKKSFPQFFFPFSQFKFNFKLFQKKDDPLTSDDKYSLVIRDNSDGITSKKKFFLIFFAFAKFMFNLKAFRKKNDPHS